MLCELCEEWKHIKCDNLKVETYQALNDDKVNDQRVHYFCSDCNEKAAKAIKLMMCTKKRMDKMEQEITELKQETAKLKGSYTEVKEMQESMNEFEVKLSDKVSNAEIKTLSGTVNTLSSHINNGDAVRVETIKETVRSELKCAIEQKIKEREELENDDYDAMLVQAQTEHADTTKIQEIQNKLESLEEKLQNPDANIGVNMTGGKDHSQEIETLTAKVKELEEKNTVTIATNSEWTEVVKKDMRKEMAKVVHQNSETGKREKNIILYRVKEKENKDEAKESDKEIIQKLMNKCEVEGGIKSVAEYKRIGAKSSNRDQPILLTFKALDMKVQLFKNLCISM